jgi:hypothetical protein
MVNFWHIVSDDGFFREIQVHIRGTNFGWKESVLWLLFVCLLNINGPLSHDVRSEKRNVEQRLLLRHYFAPKIGKCLTGNYEKRLISPLMPCCIWFCGQNISSKCCPKLIRVTNVTKSWGWKWPDIVTVYVQRYKLNNLNVATWIIYYFLVTYEYIHMH